MGQFFEKPTFPAPLILPPTFTPACVLPTDLTEYAPRTVQMRLSARASPEGQKKPLAPYKGVHQRENSLCRA